MNSICHYYDVQAVPEFAELCEHFTGKALQSPYRSTVPLLSLVRHHLSDWHLFLKSLGCEQPLPVHFEFCVESPKRGGNPSQTDAMVFSTDSLWGIEAKWTEPRYETVAKRISKPEADGADPRITLDGWLNHLRPYARNELSEVSVCDVVYQVLHRASSACAAAKARGLRPQVVYLHFHPSPLKSSATTQTYVKDLRRLHEAMSRPSDLRFRVVEWPLEPLPAFEAIQGLDKRAKASTAIVRKALCDGPLFRFGQPTIIEI